MFINSGVPLRFKPSELQYFSWIYGVSPCFPIHASKVNIISDPRKFYDTLCERFKHANRRISIASLYIGTGEMEKKLLQITKENLIQNNKLTLNILLDYQRGTRGKENSKTLLLELLSERAEQCSIALYQTPRLQGSWSKALPSRYNEIVGLQHMKLYITDDSVILSGANCSSDYFQQRQDRYVEIHDPDLANFYSELIGEISSYSRNCAITGQILENNVSKDRLVREVNDKIVDLIRKWKEKQQKILISGTDRGVDTWIFPMIQMGEFNIDNDEQITCGLLSSAPKGSYVRLATGYFNLTEKYATTLLKNCKSHISLLMAHPNANGFLGASGPAGGIPYAYSLIARKFWERVTELNQISRVQMLEYERPGWTFHAKGLWYYPPGSGVPWATVIGSANLGERSVRRDLEAQAAIVTVSSDLQERLHQECVKLHEYSTECSEMLQRRKTPLWVKATVGLFRTYF